MKSVSALQKEIAKLQKQLEKRVTPVQRKLEKAQAKAEQTQSAVDKAQAALDKAQAAHSKNADVVTTLQSEIKAIGGVVPAATTASAKRGPGRPRKDAAAKPTAKAKAKAKGKRGPGRPKKSEAEKAVKAKPKAKAKGKRGPGRPKKSEAEKAVKAKRGPGRPKKAAKPAKAAKAASGKKLPPEVVASINNPNRPPVTEAMARAMGKKVMNKDGLYEVLVAKKWLPKAGDPVKYLGYLLSTTKDTFEQAKDAGRGFYRVKAGVEFSKPADGNGAKPASKAAPKATTAAPTPKAAPTPSAAPDAAPEATADAVLSSIGLVQNGGGNSVDVAGGPLG